MTYFDSYPVSHKDAPRQTYGTAYVFYTEQEALNFAAAKSRSLKDASRVLAPVEGHHRYAPELKQWRVVIKSLAQAKRERAA